MDIEQILSHSLSELYISDAKRNSERHALPEKKEIVQMTIAATALIANLSTSYTTHKMTIVSFFGAPIVVIAKVWELILENNGGKRIKISNRQHLLWALHYMKQYPNISVLCKTMKMEGKKAPCKKTLLKWIWFYINEISELEDIVIVWENRKTNDRGDDCMVSVDCIDCKFQQILIKGPDGKKYMNKSLNSFKFKGPGLRYEVALSLLSNDIVSINGPFYPGDWPDIEIFRFKLLGMLEKHERVEADDGYSAEAPGYVRCPEKSSISTEKIAMMKRAQGRHEVMNKHLKHWKCISSKFEGKGSPEERTAKHGKLFRSCAIMKQVAMQMGEGELYAL